MLFQEYLKRHLHINEELPFEIPVRKYESGTRITETGTIERNIYFIVSGVLETCMVTKFGEKIVDFSFPNEMVTSLTSLLTEKPSDTYIACLRDSEVQIISYAKLNEACNTSLIANKFCKHFLENHYLSRVQKGRDSLSKRAEERYLDMISKRPHVIQEIPLSLIAKYLGIHPNSLSRIRKKILSSKNPEINQYRKLL